jgi:hypothetical protein
MLEHGVTRLPMVEHFGPHVAKVFRVHGGEHALTLNEMQTHPLSQAQANVLWRQPFTLIFKGPPGSVLPEGMYTLDVDGGPSFELYVMPIHTPTPDWQAIKPYSTERVRRTHGPT